MGGREERKGGREEQRVEDNSSEVECIICHCLRRTGLYLTYLAYLAMADVAIL